MEQANITFNARAIFTWTADRVYRVYVQDDVLYFIHIGGQGLGTAAGAMFGAVGALVGQALDERRARSATQGADSPQALLDTHKHNFRLLPGDVQATSIEPATTFPGHGPHVGRWLLTLPDKKLTLEFAAMVDMEVALAHLPRFFGDKLHVNVRWDEHKKRYRKP